MVVVAKMSAVAVGALPEGTPPTLLGFFSRSPCGVLTPPIYFALLFHWQTIRALLGRLTGQGRPRLLFVDKLCINQEDDDMKHQGILGLAAFLKSSSRLVLLWSPRYFTRLWCTYELATWLRLGKPATDIVLMPVSVPSLIVLSTLAFSIIVVFGSVADFMSVIGLQTVFDYSTIWGNIGSNLFIILVLASLVSYNLQKVQVELRRLDKQLSEFSILKAECFCCSQQHLHPDTKERLPCDRSLVHRTLRLWHENGIDGKCESLDYLQAFDEGVRTLLRQSVLSAVCAETVQLRYMQLLHFCLPSLWECFDYVLIEWCQGSPPLEVFGVLIGGLTASLLIVPCAFLLMFRIIAKTSGPGASCSKASTWGMRLLASFVWGPVLVGTGFLLWIPALLLEWEGHIWLQIVWAGGLTGLLCYLRNAGRPWQSGASCCDDASKIPSAELEAQTTEKMVAPGVQQAASFQTTRASPAVACGCESTTSLASL
eukprot:TRINITY_DN8512_c0_g1_i2.p1 TRINITY_DN8512_c0_g1~~TRINITY_DN8512_c0_g1_i2.p1  ORF type:complete len:484 (+),score=29.39 TRINITY_DN8512_c0_g1_i2:325-1776(+)